MAGKWGRAFQILAVVVAGTLPCLPAAAQGGDSLEAQLAAKYKVAKLGTDSSGVSVIDAGTVLVVKKGGILSIASNNVAVAPSYVKDGTVKAVNSSAMTGVNKLMKWKGLNGTEGASTETKFITVEEKVYPTKIEVNRKDSSVTLSIIECDSCNNVQDRSSRKARVVFQFPKDYLSGADGGQLSDVINQVLAIQADDGGDKQGQDSQQGQDQGQQQGGQQQPPQQAQPAQPPPTIQLGQTPDEVTAIMGQPEKVVNLGAKQIYVYKDLKVTFLKGKVSDVQ